MRLRTLFVGQVLLLLPYTLAAPTMHRRDQPVFRGGSKRRQAATHHAEVRERPTSPPTGPKCPKLTRQPTAGFVERIFLHLVRALFAEGLVPKGSILDVGASNGDTTCLFASWDPNRTVHAIDPHVDNIALINSSYARRLPNIRARAAGMGLHYVPQQRSRSRGTNFISVAPGSTAIPGAMQVEPPATVDRATGDTSFPVYRLDDIFATESLGFAHIDVEGSELEVLRAGVRTITRDQPVITFEVLPSGHTAHATIVSLLQFVGVELGYQLLLIQEECGWWNCRNILALPSSMSINESPAIALAVVTRRLIPLHPPYDESSLLFKLISESPINILSDQHHKGLVTR